MRVLITNSPLHYTHGHTFTQQDWQTLVLPTLAALCPGHEILLVDNMTGILRSHRVLENVKEFDPEVICFSIIAGRDVYNTLDVIRQTRAMRPEMPILAGGQGASFYDNLLLDAGVNVVVRGEGEKTLPEVIEALANGEKDLIRIKGISYRRYGLNTRTPDRERIKKLDETPFPSIHLMPERKSMWFSDRLTGSIETSRGCPFTCNFCAITSFWEGSFRRKSPERIVAEMEVLVRQGRSHIYMADDNFGMGEKHHAEMAELILKRGLDVRFFAQMRTDTIAKHPKLVELLARAGQYGALIGYDTYDTETFHHIDKTGSIELNNRCTEILRKNRIMIFGSHIYALPNHKRPQDFLPTYWKGRQNSDLFRMPHFSLLPGTKLYADTITDDLLKGINDPGDNRALIREPKDRARFQRWYTFLNILHVLLPDEWLKMIFHPNPNVRTIKRRGYVGIARFWFYKYARRVGISTI